jgi:hypothetical protein
MCSVSERCVLASKMPELKVRPMGILLAVDDARLQRLEHVGEGQRRRRGAEQLEGAAPQCRLGHADLQATQVGRRLHHAIAGEHARHARDGRDGPELGGTRRIGLVFGADRVPDPVLVGDVLEQVGVGPDLGRAVPAGEQALTGRGDLHRALQHGLDMLPLAAERAAMVVGDLDLAAGQLAHAAGVEVEADADEVLLGGGAGADPSHLLRP